MKDKVIGINASLSMLQGSRLAGDLNAFVCSHLSLPYLCIFPLLGTFPPTHTLLPTEFAAVLAEGLFDPVSGGDKSRRVSGQKASCSNVTPVTSEHPVRTNGSKPHGNQTAANPGNYASRFQCSTAHFVGILCS